MVFAIIAIVTTVGYVTFSLNVLDSFNQSILTRNQMTLDATKEKFDLYSVKIANNKFNVTISNSGNLPINVTRMWVQNTTATDWVNYYSINRLVSPGSILTNIGQISPVYANPAYTYNLKLITGRGNSMQFTLGSPGAKALFLQFMMVPNSLRSGGNVTALFTVVNNMTTNNSLTNLQPSVVCTKYGQPVTFQPQSGPIPSSYPYLQSGGTAFFKYVYTLTNTTTNAANHVTCTASLVGGVPGNTASDTVWAIGRQNPGPD
jgi:hypothetical protein